MRRRHLESVSEAPYGRCQSIVRIQPQLSEKGVLGHSPKRVLVWGPRRDARPAGERRSGEALEGCLSHRDSDPTWSKARDDAYAQKERPAGEAYRSSPCGDSATPPGDHKPAPKYHNKSQLQFPSKIRYLCDLRPISSHNVNFPLKKVKY